MRTHPSVSIAKHMGFGVGEITYSYHLSKVIHINPFYSNLRKGETSK
jgi:hypothetical protein